MTGGPGSGKTTIALLKAQKRIPDLKPGQEILFLSFSRAAVRQVLIGRRAADMRRKAVALPPSHSPPLKRDCLSAPRERAHHMIFNSLLADANFFCDFSVGLTP